VWNDLVAAADRVFEPTVYPDVLAVAQETMLRVQHNLALLTGRLQALGYRFTYPNAIFSPPQSDTAVQLALLERLIGQLPISLHAWYTNVGSVCFIGSHPLLTHSAPTLRKQGELLLGDPLVVAPMTLLVEEAQDFIGDDTALIDDSYLLALSPDAAHKANLSGGSYDIQTPSATVDATLLGESQQMRFVAYLRLSCQWGGFPGLRFVTLSAEQSELLAFLTADLLSF
jgi:hypothetical protein